MRLQGKFSKTWHDFKISPESENGLKGFSF